MQNKTALGLSYLFYALDISNIESNYISIADG